MSLLTAQDEWDAAVGGADEWDSAVAPAPLTAADKWAEITADPQKMLPWVEVVYETRDLLKLVDLSDRADAGDKAAGAELDSMIEEQQRPKSFGYRALDTILGSVVFGEELVLSGGAATATKAGLKLALRQAVGQAAKKAAVRRLGTHAAEKAALRAGERGALRAAGAIAQKGVEVTVASEAISQALAGTGRIELNALQRAFHVGRLSAQDAATLGTAFKVSAGDFWSNLPAGILDTFIENASEFAGPALGKAVSKLPLGALVTGAQAKIAERWLKAHPGSGAKGFVEALERVGWSGFTEEYLEEVAGGLAGAATGVRGLDQVFPGLPETAALFAASGAISGASLMVPKGPIPEGPERYTLMRAVPPEGPAVAEVPEAVQASQEAPGEEQAEEAPEVAPVAPAAVGEEGEGAEAALVEARSIAEDASLVREEREWTRAVTTPGQKVRHDTDGWVGTVVEGAADPVNGSGADALVLLEREKDGRLVQERHPALGLSPALAATSTVDEPPEPTVQAPPEQGEADVEPQEEAPEAAPETEGVLAPVVDADGNELVDMDGRPVVANQDGTITLYHRATEESATHIRSTGNFRSKENTQEAFFSTTKQGQSEGYGDAIVEVRIDPALSRIDDAFHGGEVHVAIPVKSLRKSNIVQAAVVPSEAEGKEDLSALTYKELRERAKAAGIKANQSKRKLLEALEEFHAREVEEAGEVSPDVLKPEVPLEGARQVPEREAGEEGARPPREAEAVASDEERSTGIKNAAVERELAEMGMEPAEHAERTTFVGEHARARERYESDPLAGVKLLDDLEGVERAPTAEESAVLTWEVNRLINERDAAEAAFLIDPSTENQDRIDRVRAAYSRAADIVTRAGTKSGQSLAFRKMMIARDYSLAAMERRIQVAQGGEPLSADQAAEIKSLHDKLQAAQAEHDAYVKRAEEREAEQAAEIELLRLERGAKHKARRAGRKKKIEASKERIEELFGELATLGRRAHAGVDPEVVAVAVKLAAEHIKLGYQTFAVWSEEVVERVGEWIRPNLREAWDTARAQYRDAIAARLQGRVNEGKGLAQFRPLVTKLSESFVEEGITEREALVDAVHGVLSGMIPTITRRQTMDLISGYGEFHPLSAEEVKKILRDLRGQLQQVAKIEDMEAKIPPKKTGPERRTPSDEERRLIQKVNELKKKLGVVTTDPETQLRSALDTIKRRLQNQIRDLEYQIDTKAKIVREPSAAPTDPEVQALQARRDALRAEFDALFGRRQQSEESRLRAATKAVERSIEEYERRIKEGDLAPTKRKPGPSSAELEALRARRDALREELQSLRDAASPQRTPAERALQSYKTRTANEIARMQERVFYGEFGFVVPRPARRKLELDTEATRLQAGLQRLKQRFAMIEERERRKNRTPWQKAKDTAKEVLNLPRAIRSSWDLSAAFRQGAFFAFGHPVQTIGHHIPAMLRSLTSEEYARQIMAALENRELADFAKRSKLEMTDWGESLTPHEEAIHSELSDRIPGIRASNRAFTTFLNMQRAAMFDAMVRAIPGTPTIEDGKSLAHAINIGTGRGQAGKFAAGMAAATLVLWSPRLQLSRVQLLTGWSFKGSTKATRKLIAQEHARSIMGLGAVYALVKIADAALGDEEDVTIETDSRSTDFGKVKIGNTRIDPLAGASQYIVLTTRLWRGEKKTQAGEIRPIRGEEVPYGGDTAASLLGKMLRSKLTPVLGGVVDVLAGEDVVGQPQTPLSELGEAVTPLAMQEVYEAMVEHGIPRGAALGALSIFGFGVQTYGQTESAEPAVLSDEAKRVLERLRAR